MSGSGSNGSGSNGSGGKASTPPDADRFVGRLGVDGEQTLADADQSASDADQTSADADEASSFSDEMDSRSDQSSSDRDQAISDREDPGAMTEGDRDARDHSTAERARTTRDRTTQSAGRQATSRGREPAARSRDDAGRGRDERARDRDARASSLETDIDHPTASEFERLRKKAAAARAEAARDRARAAVDRADAARERARLEAELMTARLDDLTGAYRRDLGHLAISHEIDRARRADGRFVLAFVDVDGLKAINDRDGHAAGDRALIAVVMAMREKLRSFDPILRYGGDEFVAGLAGADIREASRRFDQIQETLALRGIAISVGLAALEEGDTTDTLTERADQALYSGRRRSRA